MALLSSPVTVVRAGRAYMTLSSSCHCVLWHMAQMPSCPTLEMMMEHILYYISHTELEFIKVMVACLLCCS